MSLKPISPQDARELLRRGAALVDIRAADEHARERIAQARHVPMDRRKPAACRSTALRQSSSIVARAIGRGSMPRRCGHARPAMPTSSKAGWTPGKRRGCPSWPTHRSLWNCSGRYRLPQGH